MRVGDSLVEALGSVQLGLLRVPLVAGFVDRGLADAGVAGHGEAREGKRCKMEEVIGQELSESLMVLLLAWRSLKGRLLPSSSSSLTLSCEMSTVYSFFLSSLSCSCVCVCVYLPAVYIYTYNQSSVNNKYLPLATS